MWMDFDVRDKQKMDFFTEESIIMDYKNVLMMDLFLTNSFYLLKMLTDGLEWCGL